MTLPRAKIKRAANDSLIYSSPFKLSKIIFKKEKKSVIFKKKKNLSYLHSFSEGAKFIPSPLDLTNTLYLKSKKKIFSNIF